MSVFDMAKMYYPRLWNRERVLALVKAGRLTREEAEEILKEAEA
ncbi:MAG: XkdX family protein [Oscillospiraceae bacterium]|nr:XkdX family protein [Oscillospiraceae bacterium]